MTQAHSFGFPPVSRADARVLILGSLPGQASLAARQYYAQPRNAFWPLMGRLFGAGVDLAYEERLRHLTESGVALWDVCASARRPGSLDTKIEAATVAANDFASFFQAHRRIGLICFNGAAAERLFERHVTPTLGSTPPALRLPSTSPAHASLSFEQKAEAWSRALADVARLLPAG
ncbi:MAG: DNA-deoxyinosine glycosylase [Methylocystis sp.]